MPTPVGPSKTIKKIFHWKLILRRLFFVLVQVFNIFKIRQSLFIISIQEQIIVTSGSILVIVVIGNNNIVIKFPCGLPPKTTCLGGTPFEFVHEGYSRPSISFASPVYSTKRRSFIKKIKNVEKLLVFTENNIFQNSNFHR